MKEKLYILLILILCSFIFNFEINGSSTIPNDYIVLDYIESDSRQQTINTEYMFNLDTVIECVCDISSTQIEDNACAFGTLGYSQGGHDGNSLAFYPYHYYGNAIYTTDFYYYSYLYSNFPPVQVSSSEFSFDEKITITANVKQRSLSYTGSKTNTLFATAPFASSVCPIFIFNSGIADPDMPGYYFRNYSGCQMKLYRFTIKENDTIVMNLIPVYSKSNHINGLYDTIGNKFYKDLYDNHFLSNHEIEKFEGCAATATENGYKDAYYCNQCHEYFSDYECRNMISDGSGDKSHNDSIYEEWITTGSGLIQKHEHSFENSICSICEYKCPHENYNGTICSSCGYDSALKLKIKYANLAFEANTYILIAVEAKNNKEDPLLYVWTEGDNSYLASDSDLTILNASSKDYTLIDGNPYYIYVYDKLGIKQISDYIYCKAYCDGIYSDLFKYSILAYISNKVNSFPEEKERTQKQNNYLALFQEMCEYGYKAQLLFDYKTDIVPSLNYVPVKYKNMLYPDGSTIEYVERGDDVYFNMPDDYNIFSITSTINKRDYTIDEYERHLTINYPTTVEAKYKDEDFYYITVKSNDYSLGNIYIESEVTYMTVDSNEDYKAGFSTYGDIYHMFLDIGPSSTIEARPNDNAVFIGWNVTEGASIYNNMVLEAIFYPKVDAYISINQDVVIIYSGEKRNTSDECLNIWTENRFYTTGVLGDISTVYIDPSMYDIKGYQNYNSMFKYLYTAEEIWGIEYLDISYTTSLEGMFDRMCIETIDLTKWDVSKVKDMRYMFDSCNNLISIDLTGWNLQSIELMSDAFYSLENLETIYCDFDFSEVDFYAPPTHVFTDTPKLRGGNGTLYSEDNCSYVYARVDTEDTPGYFTLKIDN